MEKDSGLLETGAEDVRLNGCVITRERRIGNGSRIETTERNLLLSITRVLCYCLSAKLNDDCSVVILIYILRQAGCQSLTFRQKQCDKDVVFLLTLPITGK